MTKIQLLLLIVAQQVMAMPALANLDETHIQSPPIAQQAQPKPETDTQSGKGIGGTGIDTDMDHFDPNTPDTADQNLIVPPEQPLQIEPSSQDVAEPSPPGQ